MQAESPSNSPGAARAAGRFSGAVVRLVALWLLLGAGYKLLAGSPNDLPPIVREFFLGPALTFKLAIAIELSIAFVALLRPRLGWGPLTLQLGVFIAILIQLIATGATSCGCFGSKVTMPPAVMLAIDGVCLAALLLSRPWKRDAHAGASAIPIVLALLVAWAAPWALDRESRVEQVSVDESGAWKLPEKLPGYAILEPANWVGKPLAETQLAVWMDVSQHDQNAQWILYSELCDHCADFLRRREAEWVHDPKVYVLVKMLHAGPGETPVVELRPPGEEASLPPSVDFAMTPPWELTVENGVVVEAVFRGDDEH